MKPLRPAVLFALLPGLLVSTAFAGPNVEATAAAAPQAAFSPQAVPTMAEAVTRFFQPANADPRFSDLTAVVKTLESVGSEGGPTAAQVQPIVDRIRLAADEFSPVDPSEQKPPYGVDSSLRLRLLAGPLSSWLRNGQRAAILRKEVEYGSKLKPADQDRLAWKMWTMAKALESGASGLGPAAAPSVDARALGPGSPEKTSLWDEHGHLSAFNGNREIDGHDLFGDAADILDKPITGIAIVDSSRPRGFIAALRRFFEKTGAAAYLSGHVTPEGLASARSVLLDAPAAAPAAAKAASARPVHQDRFAQQLDDDYYNAHGFYPKMPVERSRSGTALNEPIAAPVRPVMTQAAALAGRTRDSELDEFIARMDEDYYNAHGYHPGEQLAGGRLREALIHYAPVLAIALFAGLLAAPHGLAILVGLARLAGGIFIVLLARKLGLRSVTDMEPGWQAWAARGLAIGLNFFGGLLILMTAATMAGLLPH